MGIYSADYPLERNSGQQAGHRQYEYTSNLHHDAHRSPANVCSTHEEIKRLVFTRGITTLARDPENGWYLVGLNMEIFSTAVPARLAYNNQHESSASMTGASGLVRDFIRQPGEGGHV